jgi:hypothetical protein
MYIFSTPRNGFRALGWRFNWAGEDKMSFRTIDRGNDNLTCSVFGWARVFDVVSCAHFDFLALFTPSISAHDHERLPSAASRLARQSPKDPAATAVSDDNDCHDIGHGFDHCPRQTQCTQSKII